MTHAIEMGNSDAIDKYILECWVKLAELKPGNAMGVVQRWCGHQGVGIRGHRQTAASPLGWWNAVSQSYTSQGCLVETREADDSDPNLWYSLGVANTSVGHVHGQEVRVSAGGLKGYTSQKCFVTALELNVEYACAWN
eukprot:PhM_4_TR3866/c0_g1_i1/m.1821